MRIYFAFCHVGKGAIENLDSHLRLFPRKGERRRKFKDVRVHADIEQHETQFEASLNGHGRFTACRCLGATIADEFHANREAAPTDVADKAMPLLETVQAFEQISARPLRIFDQPVFFDRFKHGTGRCRADRVAVNRLE